MKILLGGIKLNLISFLEVIFGIFLRKKLIKTFFFDICVINVDCHYDENSSGLYLGLFELGKTLTHIIQWKLSYNVLSCLVLKAMKQK